MTIAFDAKSNFGATSPADISYTHTPVGTPRGVLLFIMGNNGADRVSGNPTYGGVAMTEVSGSPNLLNFGEQGAVHCFFLGTGIPTGPQTVFADLIDTGWSHDAVTYTLTAAADTEVVDSDATIRTDSIANPSVTLSLAGRACFCALGFHSGHDTMGAVTPLTDWTSRFESDYGTTVLGSYSYNTIGSADVTAGWTQTAEDAAMIAVAVSEVVIVSVTSQRMMMGFGG